MKVDHCSQALYDANCIVYYCFNMQVKGRNGQVNLKYTELTDKIRVLTEKLHLKGSDIFTLNLVMDEIRRKSVAKLVDEYCDTPDARRKLGARYINDAVRYRIQSNVKTKIRKLQSKDWLNVTVYNPEEADIQNVEDFYLLEPPK